MSFCGKPVDAPNIFPGKPVDAGSFFVKDTVISITQFFEPCFRFQESHHILDAPGILKYVYRIPTFPYRNVVILDPYMQVKNTTGVFRRWL